MQKLAFTENWHAIVNKIKNICEATLAFVSSNTFLYFAFVWFVFMAVFFAITVNYGIPPDENYHFTFIRAFAENSFSPFLDINNNYFVLYDMTVKTPFFLYHYLLSFPYQIVKDSEHAYIALRLLNVALGIITLWIVLNITKALKISALARNMTIFVLSNTLMFTFLFASISYDNLFTLLSVAGVYLLLKLIQKITAKDLLLFLIVIAAGFLIKINFLPMALSLIAVFLWKYFKNLRRVFNNFKKTYSKNRTLNSFLVLILFILSLSILNSYVGNFMTYKTPFPKCVQIQSVESCQKNRIFARNKMIEETKKATTLNIAAYTSSWVPLMTQRTYGIFAHERMLPSATISYFLYAAMLILFIATIRKFKRSDKLLYAMIIICIFNIAVLLLENFNIYNQSGRPSFAVHGRYLFGVLPLMYIIGFSYLSRLKMGLILKSTVIVLMLVVFFLSSLPTYIKKSNIEWYSKESAAYINYLKEII